MGSVPWGTSLGGCASAPGLRGSEAATKPTRARESAAEDGAGVLKLRLKDGRCGRPPWPFGGLGANFTALVATTFFLADPPDLGGAVEASPAGARSTNLHDGSVATQVASGRRMATMSRILEFEHELPDA